MNNSLPALPPLVGLDDDANISIAGRSLWADARRRFLRNRAALVSLLVLAVIITVCLLGSTLSPYAYDDPDFAAMHNAPDTQTQHWFGTDNLGRDLFVRTLLGGRISLMVGALGALVAEVAG